MYCYLMYKKDGIVCDIHPERNAYLLSLRVCAYKITNAVMGGYLLDITKSICHAVAYSPKVLKSSCRASYKI